MQAIAKVFTTGNSQAVRLPKAFRVDVAEMWITKNEVTGEITLKPKDENLRKRNLTELLRMIKESPISEDFIPPRDDAWGLTRLPTGSSPLPGRMASGDPLFARHQYPELFSKGQPSRSVCAHGRGAGSQRGRGVRHQPG